jgi:hypothetical protein
VQLFYYLIRLNYKQILMKLKTLLLFAAVSTYFYSGSCGKDTPPPPSDPCAGVTITVQGSKVDASVGSSNGSITITAPVGAGVTYSLNGAAAVSTTTFSNLAVGNYSITAKNANGCSGTGTFAIVTDACVGKNIIVTAPTIVSFTPCASTPDGSLTISATGSTGFTYNVNGGTFQGSPTFNALNAGNYVIGAKDADGCFKTANVTVGNKPAGPLFTAVKALIQTNCVSCHNAGNPNGGVNFNIDCNIVSQWDRIKARAVDGNPSFMPPPPTSQLSAADKAKITNWINAGHNFTD